MNASEKAELEKWIEIISEKAASYGLDCYPTHFEVVPDHIIYELGSYVLPARFSHWTFGRDYQRQKTMYEYGMSKIYEIVFNTDPCQAFLLDSNSMLAHKFVVAHVLGHNDFFKNNIYFAHTDRRMIDKVRLNGNRIRRYEEEVGSEVVEEFLDAVLSIEEHFDTGLTAPFKRKTMEERSEAQQRPTQKSPTEFDDLWDIMDGPSAKPIPNQRKFPPEPEKDLLGFLRDYAPELTRWQRDILNMIREEMIYFIPQMRTKTINEGWACATGDSLLPTEAGFLRFDKIVEGRLSLEVASGGVEETHLITDYHIERNVPTLQVKTRRGFVLEGALKHRVKTQGGNWVYLSDLKMGERVSLAKGVDVWASTHYKIGFVPQNRSATLHDVAALAGVSLWTVLRHRAGKKTLKASDIEKATLELDYRAGRADKRLKTRQSLCVPAVLTEDLAYLLGYFVGDGNTTQSGIRLTCGDEAHAKYLDCLVEKTLSHVVQARPDHTEKGLRWRIEVHSCELLSLLSSLGIDLALKARSKHVPDPILQSPKSVVAGFLRGLFDADGYAGKAGVILSTSSSELARTVQILLLNFGILSTQRAQAKDILTLEIKGASAKIFSEEIGFDLTRKQKALESYVADRRRFRCEDLMDEVVSIEAKTNDVYDITVETAHAYVANGFVNHNSFWHERIMTDLDLTPEEHLEFRTMHSAVLSPGSKMSTNPYYVGYNIFRDIERRWNGEEDTDYAEDNWRGETFKRPSGEGMKKIFEVRQDESDTTFLRKYLTQSLVSRLDLYTYKLQEVNGQKMWVVQDTDWHKVRDAMVDGMTNFGIPMIYVEDADYGRRGELLLSHAFDGKELDTEYTGRTLKYIHQLWKRPVHLSTQLTGRPSLITFDGKETTHNYL